MQARYRAEREAAYRRGIEEYAGLIVEPTFRDFLCLYLAEGYKRSRNELELSNSDPAIMRVGVRWLRELTERPLAFGVQVHADQDLDDVRGFWANQLAIAPSAIRLQRKSNSSQLRGRTWRSEHGVLSARVSDTLLRARMQAWLDELRAEWV